jgi:Swt1-like HEPN
MRRDGAFRICGSSGIKRQSGWELDGPESGRRLRQGRHVHDARCKRKLWIFRALYPEVPQFWDRLARRKTDGRSATRRSDRAIDYTTFGELSVIITSNWALFSTIFQSHKGVERVMSNLNLLRGPIAHCCPLSEDEVGRLQLAVNDWFRMMG